MTRTIVVAVDGSKQSNAALDWSMRNVFRRLNDTLHLISVYPETSEAMPTVTHAGSLPSSVHQLQRSQRSQAHEQSLATLKAVTFTVINAYKVPKENVHTHLLPPTGGASGLAESITEFLRAHKNDLLVLGCRGLAGMQQVCMSLIGLGSVSQYCVHNSAVPTLVVRFSQGKEHTLCAEANPLPLHQAPKNVFVAIDGSEASQRALSFALDHVMSPNDQLHLMSVACTVPFDDEFKSEAQEAMKLVSDAATEAAKQHGVLRSKISTHALEPGNTGSSDVGTSISKLASEEHADMIVVGCRGLGAVSRSLMGMLGLGSVSDYLVNNSPCPVLVVKMASPDARPAAMGGSTYEGSLMHRVDEVEEMAEATNE